MQKILGGIKNGKIKPKNVTNRNFISNFLDATREFFDTKTGEVIKFAGESGYEALVEELQDRMSDAIKKSESAEDVGYLNTLEEGGIDFAKGVGNIFDYIVNGKELSSRDRQTLETLGGTALGSALLGGTFKGVDFITNKIVSHEAKTPGAQYENARNTINLFDRVLEQKKNGDIYTKSPETSNAFYKNAVKNGELPANVYLEIDTLNKILDNMKDDPVATAKLNALNLQRKIDKGEQVDLVEIPTEDFIAQVVDPNNDTLYQEIKNDITTNPAMNSMNGVLDLIKNIMKQDPEFRRQVEDTDSLYNMVYQTLISGVYGEDQASANAAIAQYILTNLANIRNDQVDIKQVMNELALRIENVENISKDKDSLSTKEYIKLAQENKELDKIYPK